jgi:exopolyphosphatase/guanosine-5'-triphosphate,3'-diphosphate pyrophosphatase
MTSEAADMAGLSARVADVHDVEPVESQPARRAGGRQAYPVRHRRHYAALDLGTNNCRLLVARPRGGGFTVVDAYSRIVRLGEGLVETGELSADAQDRTIDALAICADKIRRRGVHALRAVATEACRRAHNGAGFIDRVFRETGIALDVIAPAEEARLAVLGCQSLLAEDGGPGLVFDIGGGSTEVVLVDPRQNGASAIGAWASAPWGVVSLAETEPRDLTDPDALVAAYRRMKARFTQSLTGFVEELERMSNGKRQLLGTSGTVTTLASLYLGLPSYDRRRVDGCIVPAEAMRQISATLSAQPIAQRAELACIGTERADLVVAGCAILEAILDHWPSPEIRVADRGIREGILRSLMSRDGFRF